MKHYKFQFTGTVEFNCDEGCEDNMMSALMEYVHCCLTESDVEAEVCNWKVVDEAIKYNGERYACVNVRYKDYDGEFETIIELNDSCSDPKTEERIFFYCTSNEDLLGLMNEDNGEDFVVTEVLGYYNEI